MAQSVFVKVRERSEERLTVEVLPAAQAVSINLTLLIGVIAAVAIPPIGILLILAGTVGNLRMARSVVVVDTGSGHLVRYLRRRFGAGAPEPESSLDLDQVKEVSVVDGPDESSIRLVAVIDDDQATLLVGSNRFRGRLERVAELIAPYLSRETTHG